MEIAEWLKPHISNICPYCGSPIVDNENLTDRYCSNSKCPGHMAYKVSALADRFNVPGIGPATALQMIRMYNLPWHVDYIPLMLKTTPELDLWEVGEICMIKGEQKKWRDYCAGHVNMLAVLKDPKVPAIIKENSELVLEAERVVKVKRPLAGHRINVMMTGSFSGYRNRRDFLTYMNNKYGDFFQFYDVGKRKSGVDFLIKEAYTSDHEKSAIAASCNIPIVTPAELEKIVEQSLAYISGGSENA